MRRFSRRRAMHLLEKIDLGAMTPTTCRGKYEIKILKDRGSGIAGDFRDLPPDQ
jgi:hypothetical protein